MKVNSKKERKLEGTNQVKLSKTALSNHAQNAQITLITLIRINLSQITHNSLI